MHSDHLNSASLLHPDLDRTAHSIREPLPHLADCSILPIEYLGYIAEHAVWPPISFEWISRCSIHHIIYLRHRSLSPNSCYILLTR